MPQLMTDRLLTEEQLAAERQRMPPWTPDKAAQVAALLQTPQPHRPVLRHVRGVNRVDCTCGAKGLATVKPQAGMAPVIKAIQRHRQEL